MTDRPVFLGPRLRRLRRELGLTQTGMAADLAISPSYVALIEGNQRPVTAGMLLRIARTYRIELSDLARDDGAEHARRLQSALRDPLFADIDLPALQSADVATNYPGLTEAFLRLHRAWQHEQLALADRGADRDGGEQSGPDPVAEVRRFLAARRNSFPMLDERAERLVEEIGGVDELARHFEARHGLRVRDLPPDLMGGMIRRHDPHHRTVSLDERLDRSSRNFQLTLQLAYLDLAEPIDAALAGADFGSDNGRRLARRALASYAAAALLMPYTAFAEAVERRQYDVEALARQFGTSFEQVAHRLTTLQKPGAERVPFFFIRIDPAGNVSKRLDGAGLPFAGHGGGCPLWSVHDAFRVPGQVVTQWIALPDGEVYFSIARTVTTGGGSFGTSRVSRAVALACSADQAGKLIYTQPGPDAAPRDPTPIGISCSLCHRDRCPARALPPIGRRILPDDYHRRLAPFGFADD